MKIRCRLWGAFILTLATYIIIFLATHYAKHTDVVKVVAGNHKALFKAILRNGTDLPCANYTKREKSVTEGIDCFRLFQGDELEITRAEKKRSEMKMADFRAPAPLFETLTRNCDEFKRIRKYIVVESDSRDTSYPIAFNILMYRDVDQFERLLRAIYRPENQYCIHVDKKAPRVVKDAVESITRCFRNVFTSNKSETIVYAGFSRLVADINCMRQHIARGTRWKYLLNYASSEFPIRTNEELISILKEFNGTNDIRMTSKLRPNRFQYKHVIGFDPSYKIQTMIQTPERKSPPPFNITITKGNAYNVFSRKFVEFVLRDTRAQAFLNWTRDTYSPDELFWSSLNNLKDNSHLLTPGGYRDTRAQAFLNWSRDTYSPDELFWSSLNNLKDNAHLLTPGGYRGFLDKSHYTAKYIQWRSNGVCAGEFVRSVCVLGVRDLHRLWHANQIAANKFSLNYDPIAYSCLEQALRNKTMKRPPLNYNVYRLLHLRAKGRVKR